MGEISVASSVGFRPFRSTSGFVMATLLALVLLSAVGCPRDPQGLTPPELTYLAASQSLIHDRDLEFGEEDRQRLADFSRSAKDLLLEPGSDGAGRRYGVPAIYPLVAAPFVLLAPVRGAVVLNALLLALVAVTAAKRLSQRLGQAAVALVGVCLFASVMYRSTYLIGPTMLLAACVAIAFSLAISHEEPAVHGIEEVYRPPRTSSGSGIRGLAIGCLLGVVAIHHSLYLLLAIPAAAATPPDRRRSGLMGLAGGLPLVGLAAGMFGHLWGVPIEDLGSDVAERVSQVGVGLTTWNLLYFAVGRNVGVLPYFLPSLALLGLWKGRAGRSTLVMTAIVGSVALVVLAPFNFFGGPAAVGSAWLIPWFVLLWFLPTETLPKGWLVATALLAVPAMYPTWLAPSVEPLAANGVYRHAAGQVHRWLPLETTQEKLPPGEVMGNRFWIRSLSREAQVSGSSRWLLEGEDWAELQLAVPTELASIHLQFGPQAEAELEVRGADLGDMVLLADGGVGFRLENLTRKALHPMWWSGQKHFNYVLQFRMPMEEPRAQSLSITAIAADLDREKP